MATTKIWPGGCGEPVIRSWLPLTSTPGTYHNHLVVNSVGLGDGKKFDCSKRAYYELRRLSDELCREYQLSVIENPKGKTPRSLYFAEKNGEPTRYNLMQEACRRLDSIDRQTRLICRERLDTTADVDRTWDTHKRAWRRCRPSRRACYYRLRRCHNPKEMADIRSQRDKLTASIALCRRDIRTAQTVLLRSEKVKSDLAAERTMQKERLSPQKQHTRQRDEAH